MRKLLPLALLLAGCAGGGSTETTGPGTAPDRTAAAVRLRRLNDALILYVNDSDDLLPPGPDWHAQVGPYLGDATDDAFRSPAVPAPGYGWALNSAVVGRGASGLPAETTVTLFDSTVLGPSAIADLSTAPRPGRYDGVNLVAYLDGTVPGTPPGPNETSVGRLRQTSTALLLYTNDNDDRAPLAAWADGMTPYARNEKIFRSPIFDRTSDWGYAFNEALPGVNLAALESPAATVGIFDSTDLRRSALAPPTARPNPARYPEGNAVGFADGHVESRNP